MVLVKNTRLLGVLGKEEDMNKDKNDVIDVKFTLNGKGFGVLAVGIC